MNEICKKIECTGCSACYNSCTHGAITMTQDECGYIFPQIDPNICVECGLCRKVCPANTLQKLVYPLESLAAVVNDDEELLSCASGGIATLLGSIVIKEGGVVYGCDGTDIRNVHHARKDTVDLLEDLKGSKYVQSYIGDVYKQVKADLKKGIEVLFIGTPCQIAGLYGFLRGRIYDNLLTVDLVCHGVPSQKMLNDNIDYYCKKGEVVSVKFREKIVDTSKVKKSRIEYKWLLRKNNITDSSYKKTSYTNDAYMLGFLSCLTIRENCYTCRYACIARCSDITLSDFWGLPNNTSFEKGKGVSNILINSEKGSLFWNKVRDYTKWEQRTVVEALAGNGQLQLPSPRHNLHHNFTSLYPAVGFKKAVYKCSRRFLVIHYIKRIVSLLFN